MLQPQQVNVENAQQIVQHVAHQQQTVRPYSAINASQGISITLLLINVFRNAQPIVSSRTMSTVMPVLQTVLLVLLLQIASHAALDIIYIMVCARIPVQLDTLPQMENASNVLLAAVLVLVPLIALNAEVITRLTRIKVVMKRLNAQKENILIVMESARTAQQTVWNVYLRRTAPNVTLQRTYQMDSVLTSAGQINTT